MKKIGNLILLLFAVQVCVAQTDSTEKKLRYKMQVTTMSDNLMAGLLIGKTDSSVTIYPGTTDQYKRGKKFPNAEFGYRNIKQITAKKKGGGVRGALIGAGIGAVPAIVNAIFRAKCGGRNIGVVTIPVGVVTGAIIGSLKKKKGQVNGDKEKLKQFLTKIN